MKFLKRFIDAIKWLLLIDWVLIDTKYYAKHRVKVLTFRNLKTYEIRKFTDSLF